MPISLTALLWNKTKRRNYYKSLIVLSAVSKDILLIWHHHRRSSVSRPLFASPWIGTTAKSGTQQWGRAHQYLNNAIRIQVRKKTKPSRLGSLIGLCVVVRVRYMIKAAYRLTIRCSVNGWNGTTGDADCKASMCVPIVKTAVNYVRCRFWKCINSKWMCFCLNECHFLKDCSYCVIAVSSSLSSVTILYSFFSLFIPFRYIGRLFSLYHRNNEFARLAYILYFHGHYDGFRSMDKS